MRTRVPYRNARDTDLFHLKGVRWQRLYSVGNLPGCRVRPNQTGNRGPELQEIAELFWSQTRRTKNGAQGAAIQGPVVRHDDLTEWVLTAQHNVASHLADNVEAGMLQGSDTVPP